MGAGDALVYDYCLMHRGMPNVGDPADGKSTGNLRPILQLFYHLQWYEEKRFVRRDARRLRTTEGASDGARSGLTLPPSSSSSPPPPPPGTSNYGERSVCEPAQ